MQSETEVATPLLEEGTADSATTWISTPQDEETPRQVPELLLPERSAGLTHSAPVSRVASGPVRTQIFYPPLMSAPVYYGSPHYGLQSASPYWGPRSAPLPLPTLAEQAHEEYMARLEHQQPTTVAADGRRVGHGRSVSTSPTFAGQPLPPRTGALDEVPAHREMTSTPMQEPALPRPSMAQPALVPMRPPLVLPQQRQASMHTPLAELPNSPTPMMAGEGQQRVPLTKANSSEQPFVSKLLHLLNCEKYRPYIRWNGPGDAFILSHTNQHFASEILPMLFRHSNTSSFIRQLNMYGFTRLPVMELLEMIDNAHSFDSKISTSCFSAFSHPQLRRDQPELSKLIKPKASRSRGKKAAGTGTRKSRQAQAHPYASMPEQQHQSRRRAPTMAANGDFIHYNVSPFPPAMPMRPVNGVVLGSEEEEDPDFFPGAQQREYMGDVVEQ